MSRIEHRTSGRGFMARGGIEQSHELSRQNPAAERKELGDQDVGPSRLQRVEQERPAAVEIGIVDRLQCSSSKCPEIAYRRSARAAAGRR